MGLDIEDLVGLNSTNIIDMPLVDSQARAQRLLQEPGNLKVSIAGMRCSQGGHSMMTGGRMWITETMNRKIVVDPGGFDLGKSTTWPNTNSRPNVTVDAGTTWSELHYALQAFGLSPKVQQSSAHFSIGGALSVNCHGRDPRFGPVGNTVNWIDVLLADGSVKKLVSLTNEPDLFKAVIGGYGSCGMILRANLSLVANSFLQQVESNGYGAKFKIDRYKTHLENLLRPTNYLKNVELHYGFLNCVNVADLYNEVLSVDFKRVDDVNNLLDQADLPEEGWGETELLRAAWDESRKGYGGLRQDTWDLVVKMAAQSKQDFRLRWMRPPMSFAMHKGIKSTDMLQEYFVPLENFVPMINALRKLFQACSTDKDDRVVILSTTARLLRKDEVGVNLCYATEDRMVSIAVEAHVSLDADKMPKPNAKACLQAAIQKAIDLRGRYYLPYFGFAEVPTFKAAYKNWEAQKTAINKYNPNQKFWNQFLSTYF